MIGFENLIKNCSYELNENGVNLKIFGVTYPCSEEQLDGAILFLMRLHERVKMIRKEKNDLAEIRTGP